MKAFFKLPPYIDLLANYAMKNYTDKGFDPQDTKYSLLTITVEDGSPVFQQSVVDSKGRHLIDCWKIFHLAKMIKEDQLRSFWKLRIRIDFRNGMVSRTSYTIIPLKDE